jgi:hypothetical protein
VFKPFPKLQKKHLAIGKKQPLAISHWQLAFVFQCEMCSQATARQQGSRASQLPEMPKLPNIAEIGKPSTQKTFNTKDEALNKEQP